MEAIFRQDKTVFVSGVEFLDLEKRLESLLFHKGDPGGLFGRFGHVWLASLCEVIVGAPVSVRFALFILEFHRALLCKECKLFFFDFVCAPGRQRWRLALIIVLLFLYEHAVVL